MRLLRERRSDLGVKHLTSSQEPLWMIALYVNPKNSNHLRSHSGAIMALDDSRLGMEKKILGKQIRPNFLLSTSLLYKIWRRVNQPFILFIHHI